MVDTTDFLLTEHTISRKETAAVRTEISFSEAIDAHLDWKRRLVESLNAPGRRALMLAEVGNASACTLGQWIDGAGERRYGDLSSFAELREDHRSFHVLARRVVELHRSNDRHSAQALLKAEFQQAGHRIVERLKHLSDVFGN